MVAKSSSSTSGTSIVSMESLEERMLLDSGTFWYLWDPADATGDVGQYSSLKLDADGNPHISYFDKTNGDLKYVVGDASAKTWSAPVTIDNSCAVGQFTSLAFDSSGNPHIAYYLQTFLDDSGRTRGGDLKYASLDGVDWTVETIDWVSNGVGQFVSLDIDNLNVPHISYYDAFSEDLKYATLSEDQAELSAVTVDMTFDPAGSLSGGVLWEQIDSVIASSGILTVTLSDGLLGVGTLVADAIRVTDGTNIFVVDNGDYQYSDSGAWADSASGYKSDSRTTASGSGDTATWVFKGLQPGVSYDVYVTWQTDAGNATDATFTLLDGDGTWALETIDSAGKVGAYTSIEVDAAGKPRISYYNISGGDLKYAEKDSDGVWAIETVDGSTALGQLEGTTSVDQTAAPDDYTGGDGTLWEQIGSAINISNGVITVRLSDLGDASVVADAVRIVSVATSAEFIVDNGTAAYSESGVGWSALGTGYNGGSRTHLPGTGSNSATWTFAGLDDGQYDIFVTWVTDAANATNASFSIYDGSLGSLDLTDVGQFTSLALDEAGQPHITYYDVTNRDLKHAWMTGGDWQIETVDSGGDVGQFTSMALDAANKPHISYLDYTNGDLKYARWTGAAWEFELVDDLGWDAQTQPGIGANVAFTTSLEMSNTGGIFISYFNYSNTNLHLASQNHKPTLTNIFTLPGAIEDTPFTITYDLMKSMANESDVEDDEIFFRVEDVTTGTLTKGGVAVTPGVTLLGTGESLVWTPATNENNNNYPGAPYYWTVPAFTVIAWTEPFPGADSNNDRATSGTAVQVKVNVAPVNDAPTLSNSTVLTGGIEDSNHLIAYGVLLGAANEADIDGDTISFRFETLTSGTLLKNGVAAEPGVTLLGPGEEWVWRPDVNAAGVLEAFTIRAWDGLAASSHDVPINVDIASTNVAPTLTVVNTLPGASAGVDFDITYTTLADAADEADADPEDTIVFLITGVTTGTLTKDGVAVVPGETTLGAGETLVWNTSSMADGAVPAFTVQAYDGELASGTDVTVNIGSNAPTLTTVDLITGATENSDFTLTYDMLADAADEFDEDGDTLSFLIAEIGDIEEVGTLTKGGLPVIPGETLLGPGESIVWTPPAHTNGTIDAVFSVKAYDGLALSADPVDVNIDITPCDNPDFYITQVTTDKKRTFVVPGGNVKDKMFSRVGTVPGITFAVVNNGTLPANGLMNAEVFLSTSSTFDPLTATLLQSKKFKVKKMKVGKKKKFKFGKVVPPERPDLLAQAMREMATEERSLYDRGIQEASKLFDIRAVADRFLQIVAGGKTVKTCSAASRGDPSQLVEGSS